MIVLKRYGFIYEEDNVDVDLVIFRFLYIKIHYCNMSLKVHGLKDLL